jgi:hypothetical protein
VAGERDRDLGVPRSTPVLHFMSEEWEQPVVFGSVGAMLATIAEADRRGVIFVTSDGRLEMDYDVFDALVKELNPDSEGLWTD